MCVLSHVWLFATSWTVAHQSPLSMEFSRSEYWSEWPFPSLGDRPNPVLAQLSLLMLCNSQSFCMLGHLRNLWFPLASSPSSFFLLCLPQHCLQSYLKQWPPGFISLSIPVVGAPRLSSPSPPITSSSLSARS